MPGAKLPESVSELGCFKWEWEKRRGKKDSKFFTYAVHVHLSRDMHKERQHYGSIFWSLWYFLFKLWKHFTQDTYSRLPYKVTANKPGILKQHKFWSLVFPSPLPTSVLLKAAWRADFESIWINKLIGQSFYWGLTCWAVSNSLYIEFTFGSRMGGKYCPYSCGSKSEINIINCL